MGQGRPRKELGVPVPKLTSGDETSVGDHPQKGGAMVGTGTAKVIKSLFSLVLYLVLFLAPFYFLPPILPGFLFYKDIALVAVSLLLIFLLALRLALNKEFEFDNLAPKPLNLSLLIAAIIWGLSIFFSPARVVSLATWNTWAYLAFLIILFIQVNHIKIFRPKLAKSLLGVSVMAVVITWLLVVSPVYGRISWVQEGRLLKPQFLGLVETWIVSVDAVKNRPFLGIGPGLYSTAFQLYKPMRLNFTNNWNLIFEQTAWPLFNTLATQGLLGFSILLLIITQALRWVLSKEAIELDDRRVLKLTESWGRVAALTLLALVAIAGFTFGRRVYAQMTYQKALQSIIDNQAQPAYDGLRSAINLFPDNDLYHRSFGALNITLAGNISRAEGISDNDRQLVLQLVEQAIREGRIVSELINPWNSINWQVRASIYQQLIGVIDQTQDWALNARLQAVYLDPNQPLLRVDLGGLYYFLGTQEFLRTKVNDQEQQLYSDLQKERFIELAADQFRIAANLKPDWPNAHYNLANTYQRLGKKDLAQLEYQNTLDTLPADSPDRAQVEQEMGKVTPTPSPNPLQQVEFSQEEEQQFNLNPTLIPTPFNEPSPTPSPTP